MQLTTLLVLLLGASAISIDADLSSLQRRSTNAKAVEGGVKNGPFGNNAVGDKGKANKAATPAAGARTATTGKKKAKGAKDTANGPGSDTTRGTSAPPASGGSDTAGGTGATIPASGGSSGADGSVTPATGDTENTTDAQGGTNPTGSDSTAETIGAEQPTVTLPPAEPADGAVSGNQGFSVSGRLSIFLGVLIL